MSVQAARQGRGIALVPDIIATEEVEAGTLRIPHRADLDSAGHYCLLVPDGNLERPTIKAFRDWIVELTKNP
jgi:LysR family glycine cleavage system transcriptional activator